MTLTGDCPRCEHNLGLHQELHVEGVCLLVLLLVVSQQTDLQVAVHFVLLFEAHLAAFDRRTKVADAVYGDRYALGEAIDWSDHLLCNVGDAD